MLNRLHPSRLFYSRRLARLRGQYGGRCFIMGNGPSLNEMDLELFAGETVWGLNKCHLLFERISWRPKFHVGADRVVIPDMRDELVKMCETLPETRFFVPNYFIDRGLIPIRQNMALFRDVEPTDELVFSTEAERFVYKAKTVTIVALQIAAYLGFNPIYLIGCDTNYVVPATVEREGEMTLRSTADDDPNHFAGNYFGKSSLWRDPHPEAMLRNYALVAEATDKIGVKIFNATIGGKLEAFPRIDYRNIIS